MPRERNCEQLRSILVEFDTQLNRLDGCGCHVAAAHLSQARHAVEKELATHCGYVDSSENQLFWPDTEVGSAPGLT